MCQNYQIHIRSPFANTGPSKFRPQASVPGGIHMLPGPHLPGTEVMSGTLTVPSRLGQALGFACLCCRSPLWQWRDTDPSGDIGTQLTKARQAGCCILLLSDLRGRVHGRRPGPRRVDRRWSPCWAALMAGLQGSGRCCLHPLLSPDRVLLFCIGLVCTTTTVTAHRRATLVLCGSCQQSPEG